MLADDVPGTLPKSVIAGCGSTRIKLGYPLPNAHNPLMVHYSCHHIEGKHLLPLMLPLHLWFGRLSIK